MHKRVGLTGLGLLLIFFQMPQRLHAVDVYTDPVGFITLTIRGTNGTPPGTTSALSYLGLGMTQLVVKQGRITGAVSNELVDALATWSDDQFNGSNGAHFIEITSGPFAGTIDDVVKTVGATKKLYTANNLASLGIPNISNQTYRIRKHWTLASVFGPTNQAGLKGGTSASNADNIIVPDGTGGLITYWYKSSGIGGTGWRKGGNATVDVANDPLHILESIVIRRRDGTNIALKLVGAVKLARTIVPIEPGDNLRGNIYAAGFTLNTSGLYTTNSATGLKGGTSAASADNVLLPTGPFGTLETYWYKDAGFPPGTGWRKGSDSTTNVGTNLIELGQGMVIKRKSPNPAFDWYIPSPY